MSLVLMVTGTRCDRPDTRDVVCAARLRVTTATGDDSEESVSVVADVSPTCTRRDATRRGRSVGRSVGRSRRDAPRAREGRRDVAWVVGGRRRGAGRRGRVDDGAFETTTTTTTTTSDER